MPRPDIWLCNIKQLPYQPVVKVQIAENIPRGLKPVISYQAFAARLKSCPFKTRLSPRAVRREFDEFRSDHGKGCASGGLLLRGLLRPDKCRLAGLQRRGGRGSLFAAQAD